MAAEWKFSFSGSPIGTSAGTVSMPITQVWVGPLEPEAALHPLQEQPVAFQTPPPPFWYAPRELHGYVPIDWIIAAASLGVIVAWHVRRADLARNGRRLRGA